MSKEVFDKIAEGLDEALDHVSTQHDVPPLLTKCCTKCGEWKPRIDFTINRAAKDGRDDELLGDVFTEAEIRSAVA